MKKLTIALSLAAAALLTGCLEGPGPSADQRQAAAQERLLQEGTSQTGMPAIKNFRERKLLKMIYELRDQEGMTTWTYLVSQQTGRLALLCQSVGYAISDATGYTNPERIHESSQYGYAIMPQAEPNGLFTPDNSNTSWVMCVGPKGEALPTMVQSEFVVSPFELGAKSE